MADKLGITEIYLKYRSEILNQLIEDWSKICFEFREIIRSPTQFMLYQNSN